MRILVDTSVWIAHFRGSLTPLSGMLRNNEVLTHAVILGELAIGHIPNRSRVLKDLVRQPRLPASVFTAVLDFIELSKLHGSGLSWGDAQLLCSARERGVPLWSIDRKLEREAQRLGLGWLPPG